MQRTLRIRIGGKEIIMQNFAALCVFTLCVLCVKFFLPQNQQPIRVELYENKKQNGERPQRRTAVAKKR